MKVQSVKVPLHFVYLVMYAVVQTEVKCQAMCSDKLLLILLSWGLVFTFLSLTEK